jgi:hypothetical protein
MYTNEDSVTIGLGITLNELVENNYRPFELLEKLKEQKEDSEVKDNNVD